MSDYVPKFEDPGPRTYTAGAAITGGQVVEITGVKTVSAAGANSEKVVGVAGFDVTAGQQVTVYNGGVQRPIASGAIVAGTIVLSAAAGKVIATNGTPTAPMLLGVATTTAADGAQVDVHWFK